MGQFPKHMLMPKDSSVSGGELACAPAPFTRDPAGLPRVGDSALLTSVVLGALTPAQQPRLLLILLPRIWFSGRALPNSFPPGGYLLSFSSNFPSCRGSYFSDNDLKPGQKE